MDGTGTSSAPLVVHCGGGGGPCQFLAVEQVDARDISVTEPCGPVPAHGEERTCGRWCCVSVVDGAGWGWVCRITLGAGMGQTGGAYTETPWDADLIAAGRGVRCDAQLRRHTVRID